MNLMQNLTKEQETVPLLDPGHFGGIALNVGYKKERCNGNREVVLYKFKNKYNLLFPIKRSSELRPKKVEDLLSSINKITGLEVSAILSKRGLLQDELNQLQGTQEQDVSATIIGRLWILVSLGYSVNGNLNSVVDTVEAVIGREFEYLPLDKVLNELNPLASIPIINPRMNFFGLKLQEDYDMFTVDEVTALMQTTGTPSLLRGSEIYLGTHPETKEPVSINLGSLSNNMIMVLGTSGKGKSVLAGQMAYRIAGKQIVIDVGGPSKQGIGWNSDPHFYTVKLRSNQLIDIMTADFQSESAYIETAKALLRLCGISIVGDEMKKYLSYLYHSDDRSINALCKLLKINKDIPEMKSALHTIEEIQKIYQFIPYPKHVLNIEVLCEFVRQYDKTLDISIILKTAKGKKIYDINTLVYELEHTQHPEMERILEGIEKIRQTCTLPHSEIKNVHFDISKAKESTPPNTYLLFALISENMSIDEEDAVVEDGLFKHAVVLEEVPKLLDSLEIESPMFNNNFIKGEVLRMLTGYMRDSRKREFIFLMLVHTYSEVCKVKQLYELWQHCDLKIIFDSTPLYGAELNELMENYDRAKISIELEKNRTLGNTTTPRTFCAIVANTLMLVQALLTPNHLAIINPEYNRLIGKQPLIIKGEISTEMARDLHYSVFYPKEAELPPITVYTPPFNDGTLSARIALDDKHYVEKTLASVVLGTVGIGTHGKYYLSTNRGDKTIVIDGLFSEITFIRQQENLLKFMNGDGSIKNFTDLLKFLLIEGVDLEPLSDKWDGALAQHIEYARNNLKREYERKPAM